MALDIIVVIGMVGLKIFSKGNQVLYPIPDKIIVYYNNEETVVPWSSRRLDEVIKE